MGYITCIYNELNNKRKKNNAYFVGLTKGNTTDGKE